MGCSDGQCIGAEEGWTRYNRSGTGKQPQPVRLRSRERKRAQVGARSRLNICICCICCIAAVPCHTLVGIGPESLAPQLNTISGDG